jgi:hypothetical protein
VSLSKSGKVLLLSYLYIADRIAVFKQSACVCERYFASAFRVVRSAEKLGNDEFIAGHSSRAV